MRVVQYVAEAVLFMAATLAASALIIPLVSTGPRATRKPEPVPGRVG